VTPKEEKACALVTIAIVMGIGAGIVILTPNKPTIQEIVADPSAWVNKTVTIEGYLSPILDTAWWWPPFHFELSSNPITTGTSIADNRTGFGSNAIGVDVYFNYFVWFNYLVVVTGVVTTGRWTVALANGTEAPFGPLVYFIYAQDVQNVSAV
jgi:hypothetical protein